MTRNARALLAAVAAVMVAAAVGIPIAATATHGYQPQEACPNRNTAPYEPSSNPYGVRPAATGPTAQEYDKPGVVHPGVMATERTIRCVHVGGGDVYKQANPDKGNFVLTRFYPDTLKVRRGDIVEFRPAPGWAGTTHSPGIFDPAPKRNELRSPLKPAVDQLVRRDELPDTIVFNHEIATGSGLGTGCGLKNGSRSHGLAPQMPCVISTVDDDHRFDLNESFTNVGRPQPFWVQIDLPVGIYQYYCTYHSWMVGTIEVVAADRPVPSHDDVSTEALRLAQADVAEAQALQRELNTPRWRQVGDEREWEVTTGANTDSGHATIIGYMPATLRVRKGDRVRFVGGRPDAPTLVGRTAEAQTVTFPGEAVGGFYSGGCTISECSGTPWIDDVVEDPPDAGPEPPPPPDRLHTQAAPHGLTLPVFPWSCDYDGFTTGLPGVPKTWIPRRGCAPEHGMGKFELFFSDFAAGGPGQRAEGDAVISRTTLHNSGWMVPSAYSWPYRTPWKDDTRWPTEFTATFPKADRFTYGCLLHPDVMTGSITVEDV